MHDNNLHLYLASSAAIIIVKINSISVGQGLNPKMNSCGYCNIINCSSEIWNCLTKYGATAGSANVTKWSTLLRKKAQRHKLQLDSRYTHTHGEFLCFRVVRVCAVAVNSPAWNKKCHHLECHWTYYAFRWHYGFLGNEGILTQHLYWQY